jgi:serine/threonine protein kinase
MGAKAYIDIIRQSTLGLQELHKKGLYHNDVKAPNFLIKRTGGKTVAKTADLGMARYHTALPSEAP